MSKISRLIAQILMASIIAAAAVSFTAGSASAATAVTACFKWSTGALYKNQPVYLVKWTSTKGWVNQGRSGKTNSSGCATFSNTPTTLNLRVAAMATLGDANLGWDVWFGLSPYYAPSGSKAYTLGWGVVSYHHCIYGLLGTCGP